ncbi:MAG: hypothetical protein Q9N26_06800 [Aquificota bacterium]|nr:hypothetical protein [Aquificota bacterium]MDQ7083246.1 hypothetical protein [Aquificota bacterium]
MNPFLMVAVGVLLFLGNLLYSAYSLKVVREHSLKLNRYKTLKEENLKLKADIERLLNIKDLERYAVRRGFRPFSWEEFVIYVLTEPSGKGRSRERRR